MIFLIDDSPSSPDLLEFSEILRVIDNPEQLEAEWKNLETASGIMIHRSFGHSNIFKERVDILVEENGDTIPLVVFSGGDNIVNYPGGNRIIEMKKTDFYENFKAFLTDYTAHHTPNLAILAYGPKYKAILMLRAANRFLQTIGNDSGTISTERGHILGNDPDLQVIIETAQPGIGYSKQQLRNLICSGEYTFETLKLNIKKTSQSIAKYGKNICHW